MPLPSSASSCFLCGNNDENNSTCQDCLADTGKQVVFCKSHRCLHQIPDAKDVKESGNCYPYEVAVDNVKGRYGSVFTLNININTDS